MDPNTIIPRHAKLQSGSLFPFHPVSMKQIAAELSVKYWLTKTGSKVVLEYLDNDQGSRGGIYTPIPTRYENLVRRFLFRGMVLGELLYCKEGTDTLSDDIREAMRSNLLYHFSVLKSCRPAFRDAAERGGELNVRLFDIHMLEEHYVGRHDPAAVILWQRGHSACNLRTANVFELGEWLYYGAIICPNRAFTPQIGHTRRHISVWTGKVKSVVGSLVQLPEFRWCTVRCASSVIGMITRIQFRYSQRRGRGKRGRGRTKRRRRAIMQGVGNREYDPSMWLMSVWLDVLADLSQEDEVSDGDKDAEGESESESESG